MADVLGTALMEARFEGDVRAADALEQEFDAVWAAGAALSWEEAAAYARKPVASGGGPRSAGTASREGEGKPQVGPTWLYVSDLT
jgi:hypothetical protein